MDTTKNFNKGKALLKSILITLGILLGLILFTVLTGISGKILWYFIGIFAFIYCKKNNIRYEKNLSNSPWVYLILIWFIGEIGSIVFFYEIQKVKAKKEGKNTDIPKGKLFISIYICLILLFSYIFVLGIFSGYNSAMEKYNQEERNLQMQENELAQ